MKEGEISPIIENEDGYHIYRVIKKQSRYTDYSNEYIFIPYPKEESQVVKNELDSIRKLIVNKKISLAKAVRKFSQDTTFKADNQGIMRNDFSKSNSSKIPLDELDTYIYFVIDTMQ